MIRDFELIRKILLEVRAKPAGTGPITVSFDDEYTQNVVNEHAELLVEAGLLKGQALRGSAGLFSVNIEGLTWEGHDFIEAAINDSIWNKSLTLIKEKGGAVSFEVLKALLNSLIREALKLP